MDFNQIYHQYNQAIFRLCLGYTNDESWAKDLVQETFIAAWKSRSKFRGEAEVSTWLYRIAVNGCIKQLKKRKKRTLVQTIPEMVAPEKEESPKLLLLRKFIAELPEIDRLIISMELEEIPQAEIANIIGMKSGSIRVRIHRIKERLSQSFKTSGYV